MTKSGSACACFDVTISREVVEADELKAWMGANTKKWGFQREIGAANGYDHWQGRFSLIKKLRLSTLVKTFPWKGGHDGSVKLSYTSDNARQDMLFYNYVTKKDCTATGERYTDKDTYIPRQIRKIKKLKVWQQKIITINETPDDDHINVVIDYKGYIGKSTLALWAECHGLGFAMPPVEIKEMMQIALDRKTYLAYFIDIPRSLDQLKLGAFWAGIESLKRGKVYDLRYKYRQRLIDAPHIWVFMNEDPDIRAITERRWKLWSVADGDLKKVDISVLKKPKVKRRLKGATL